MGEVELDTVSKKLVIHSLIYFYGDAANDIISRQVAKDIEDHWNAIKGKAFIHKESYSTVFDIVGIWEGLLTPEIVYENTNPRNNYFRIEEHASGNISFVDGINSNTGYFKLENLLHHSTTAAHEYGHTIGLVHPKVLDIRGRGTPSIMYPRGTFVDPAFQYDATVVPGERGGTLNPFLRKVLQEDIDNLQLHRLNFNRNGFSVVGDFTSVWHDKHAM